MICARRGSTGTASNVRSQILEMGASLRFTFAVMRCGSSNVGTPLCGSRQSKKLGADAAGHATSAL